jgi:general secretion pathway protein A
MFLKHFGLREQPFGVTPDPHFLYFSSSHLEALASLFYGIQTQRGFMALIAKPGMGKTTLLFHLLDNMRHSARTAFLFQTHCDSREFLRSLMADLGINDQDDDLGRMHRKLNEVLIREFHAGRRVVVVIDEAQNLEDSVLETVRMLSNFEIPGTKLMQILLAGQPQLADKLASRNMVQLRQRISILSRLAQFSASETADYISHRLRVAGYRGKSPFTPDALAMIHSCSGGIPRNINNLCFQALTLGFANSQNIVDGSILDDVLKDLDMETLGSGAVNERRGVTHLPGAPMTSRFVTNSKTC